MLSIGTWFFLKELASNDYTLVKRECAIILTSVQKVKIDNDFWGHVVSIYESQIIIGIWTTPFHSGFTNFMDSVNGSLLVIKYKIRVSLFGTW